MDGDHSESKKTRKLNSMSTKLQDSSITKRVKKGVKDIHNLHIWKRYKIIIIPFVLLVAFLIIANMDLNSTATSPKEVMTTNPYTNKLQQVTLNDPLHTSTWGAEPGKTPCKSGSNGLVLNINPSDIKLCYATIQVSNDYTYQITMNTDSGVLSSSGLVFNADSNQFYTVAFTANDGTVDIEHWTFDTGAPNMDSVNKNLVHCGKFNKGLDEPNLLAVHVDKQNVHLFVNHEECGNFTMQQKPMGKTTVGVIMFADLGKPTTVTYTDAYVWGS